MVETVGVILAGGDSTRFGSHDKALARFDDRPLVVRAVEAVRAATSRPPVVAVRRDQQRTTLASVLEDVTFTEDYPEQAGPLAGVFGALESSNPPWLFVCGCDMPLVSAAAIEWLATRLAEPQTAEYDAIVPVHRDGTLEPMHTFYRRTGLERVRDSLPKGASLQALLENLAVRPIAIEDAPDSIALGRSTININTRAELAALRDEGPVGNGRDDNGE